MTLGLIRQSISLISAREMRRESKNKNRGTPEDKNGTPKPKRVITEVTTEMVSPEYLETHIPIKKIRVDRDIVFKVIHSLVTSLAQEIEVIETFQNKKLLSSSSLRKVACHFFFLRSHFFRFESSSHQQSLCALRGLQSAVQCLVTALEETKSILRDEGLVYVRNQQEFCQYFKYLFGKDSKVFYQKYLRKLLQEIWNFIYFGEKCPLRVHHTLNLWAHGLSIPLNPARIHLHRAVINSDADFIQKACQFRKKAPIYCHVNQADANGITPIMLAVYLQKQDMLPTLLLEHADPYLVPLTLMPNPSKVLQEITEQIQFLRGPLKLNKMYLPQRHTKNAIEYCRDNNVQLLAKLLALDMSRQFYSLKSNKSLLDDLEKIPDCSFLISWKQQGRLFGEAYSDTIKIYKKRASIRFDFCVFGVLDRNVSKGSYSLVFKGKPDIEYYLVDYNTRKITNLIKEPLPKQVEESIIRVIKDSVVGREVLTECLAEESTIKNTKTSYKQTLMNLVFERQNIRKDGIEVQQYRKYQDSIANSDIIQYQRLTHSQLNYVLQEPLPRTRSQVKTKKTQDKVKVQVNTIPFFQLSMEHLLTITTLLQYYSPHASKGVQILKWQKMLEELCSKGIFKDFPTKIVLEMKGIHLTITLEGFNFIPVKNDMFQLLSALEENNFDCTLPRGTSFVERSMSFEESFMSSASKFLRPGEEDVEFEEACTRYKNLLGEFNGQDSASKDDQPSDRDQQKQCRNVRGSPFSKNKR